MKSRNLEHVFTHRHMYCICACTPPYTQRYTLSSFLYQLIDFVLHCTGHCSRHMLVKPKTWKLGTTETLSLMIYNNTYHNRSIQAILFKRECGCRSTNTWFRRITTCGIPVGEYKIFSHVESQAIPGGL